MAKLENPIDFERLSEIYGDEEVNEILQLFVPETERLLQATEQAIKDEDGRTLQSAAHQLKGLTASVAASEMADLSLQLESAAKTGDWTAALKQQELLRAAFDRVLKFVEQVMPQS